MSPIALGAREAHVYSLEFAPHRGEIERLGRWLSSEECQRAARFRFDIHRENFILSHAFKRRVLANYLGIGPRQVPVVRHWTGKPALDERVLGARRPGFSLAHSARHAVVGVACTESVGIDVEQYRADVDVIGLAERYFAADEVAALRGLAPVDAVTQFFRIWTSKEAFVKAIGLGLSYPLSEFCVGRLDQAHLQYTAIGADYGPPSAWSLRTYTPEPGCFIAVAVRCASATVSFVEDKADLLDEARVRL